MKIATLLAPYLLREKRLDLPRIGSFRYSPAMAPELEKSRSNVPGSIDFVPETDKGEEQKLVDYISAQTGKMKSLAASDLSSYSDLALELINTGKPFHLEAVGTLIKQSNGELAFVPALSENEKIREKSAIDVKSNEVPSVASVPAPSPGRSSRAAGGILVPVMIILGLGLAIGGGYFFYKNKSKKPGREVVTNVESQPPSADTSVLQTSIATTADTAAQEQKKSSSNDSLPSNTYKFVYETTSSKKRALRRYAQVHELIPAIQMEALNDSSMFKIYIIKQTEDTSQTKLQLKAWYYGTAPKYVTIE